MSVATWTATVTVRTWPASSPAEMTFPGTAAPRWAIARALPVSPPMPASFRSRSQTGRERQTSRRSSPGSTGSSSIVIPTASTSVSSTSRSEPTVCRTTGSIRLRTRWRRPGARASSSSSRAETQVSGPEGSTTRRTIRSSLPSARRTPRGRPRHATTRFRRGRAPETVSAIPTWWPRASLSSASASAARTSIKSTWAAASGRAASSAAAERHKRRRWSPARRRCSSIGNRGSRTIRSRQS